MGFPGIMALDYGDKTIGVAVSDALGITAHGVCVIEREGPNSFKKSLACLKEIIKEHKVETIVLGYPKNLNGTESTRCAVTQEFAERLKRNFKKIPVVLWDERLSTMGADRALQHLSKAKRDRVIDEMAAVYILQAYLDFLKTQAQ